MIAKRIPRTKGTSNVARLVRYMVAAQGKIEPESWKRTADYILDTKKTTTQGEKVASWRVSNCGTDDPAVATSIIEVTQAQNTRSKTDKTYHLVYSFPPGELPPLDVLHDIEDELCAAIGLADHQRISAVHQDTDHYHVHVAINKVHPTGLQNIEPYYDMPRLMEACEQLEIKHGLTRTNHGLEKGKTNGRTNAQRDRADIIRLGPEREHDTRFRAYLRESYNRAIAERPEAKTYNDLRNLSGSGLAYSSKRYSSLLPGDARHHLQQRGQEPADSLRRQGNGAGGNGAERRVASGIADLEAQTGIVTLAGYVAAEVAPALREATTWHRLHEAFAEHGLQLKPRGAGFVIGDGDLDLWCKASSAGRDFSMKALTDRLGPFERPKGAAPPPKKRYTPQPRQAHPSSAGLYTEYQRQRQQAGAERKNGLAAIRKEQADNLSALQQWSKRQRWTLRMMARGPARKVGSANITRRTQQERQSIKAEAARKRQALIGSTALPGWQEWLVLQANAGKTDALAVLRARTKQAEQWRGNLLSADEAERAKTAIMKSLKAHTRRDGAVSYKTADGGIVVDRSNTVQASDTTGAAFIALNLAAERFEGQALNVQGSDQFRQDVARLAGLHKLDVVFSDPALETMRQASRPQTMTAQPEPAPAPAKPTPARQDELTPAGLKWIDNRNEARSTISSIDHNRPWTPSDAGTATYQGRRRMEDGSEILLLKRGDETLVKASSPRVVAKASRWRIGQAVTLDKRGRFIDKSKGITR